MATPIKSDKIYCTMGDHFVLKKHFWQSESIVNTNGVLHICSDCVNDLFEKLYKKHKDKPQDFKLDGSNIEFDTITEHVLKETCRYIDLCFNYDAYNAMQTHIASFNTNGRTISKIFGIYKSKLSSTVKNNKNNGSTYDLSDNVKTEKLNIVKVEDVLDNVIDDVISKDDLKNKQDVIRLMNYDPFEFEKEEDKKYLYNTLVDYLDESTLEDSFKLPVCIEITKGFNHLNHINNLISKIDYSNADATGKIKTLISAKDTLMKTLLNMAKDNGISVNHATNKSKGAGTLAGIIKKLQEYGFDEIDINLFDIETEKGIKQVADISNKSILDQLMLDENDYTSMIEEQRILIDNFRNKYEKAEEENRLMRIKIASYKEGEL